MAMLRSRGGDETLTNKSGGIPWLRYAATEGVYMFVPAGYRGDQGIPVRIGTLVIPDLRRLLEGELCFNPYDTSLMVPRGQPLPPRCGKPGYMDGMQIDVLVKGLGLATFTSTADTVCGMLDALYNTYCFAAEAQEGKLPICRIDPSRSFQSKHGSTIYPPRWPMIAAWVLRNQYFRDALMPIPSPTFEPQVITSDTTFSDMKTLAGTAEAKKVKRGKTVNQDGSPAAPDADLDDVIPF
jgi:hypothetical protein